MANEIKVTVEAPELVAAITALTSAITGGKVAPQETATQQAVQNAAAAQTSTYSEITPSAQPVANAPAQTAPTTSVQPSVTEAANYQPSAPNAPQAAPQPAQSAPAKAYTLDDLSKAAAALITQQNKMAEVLAVLGQFGVQAVSQLQPAQYDAFANAIRQLGATI